MTVVLIFTLNEDKEINVKWASSTTPHSEITENIKWTDLFDCSWTW